MEITRRSVGVGILVGALVLLFWPHAAKAGDAGLQMEDTLNTVIKRGELIVGSFDFFPPWGFRDAQNNLVGMDVDIAKELADVLKVKLTLLPIPNGPDRISFLITGKIDVAISNFTANLERAKTINFTNPYVIDGLGVMYRKELKIKNWSDLNGKQIAIMTGSTAQEAEVLRQVPKVTFQRFEQASTALLALQQGKADAMVDDYTYTVYHAGRDKNLAYLEKPIAFAPYCIGLRKHDPEWLNYLNFFVYRLQQTGKVKELYKKWFGAEPYRVSPIW